MSSKIGMILSLIFVFVFFLLGADLICIQYLYSDLDSKSVTIAYYISKSARLDEDYISNIEDKFAVNFECLNEVMPISGDVCDFVISTNYMPMLISSTEMEIKVARSTVLGYYG